MCNEKIILECSKEIGKLCESYYPSCDKAYFQGIYANGGELVSIDVFFEKDGMLIRKNLVAFNDLIDCHQPRNIDDQKVLMRNLMKCFVKFSEAFKSSFEPCFSIAEITLVNGNNKYLQVRFNYDQNVLDSFEGGAHEYHQKYFEQIENQITNNQWWREPLGSLLTWLNNNNYI